MAFFDLFVFSVVPGVFGNQQAQYLDVIKQMLQQCLQDQANPPVSKSYIYVYWGEGGSTGFNSLDLIVSRQTCSWVETLVTKRPKGSL